MHVVYNGSDSGLILHGIATDPVVCSKIASCWNGSLFSDEAMNTITGWCVDHMRRYGVPPNGELKLLFEKWASTADEERARAVEAKLIAVSKRFKDAKTNPDYVLDRAGHYFSKVEIQRRLTEAQQALDRDEVREAHEQMIGTNLVQLGSGSVTSLCNDFLSWREALDEEREKPLLRYPQQLERFFGTSVCRDSLLAFMGPDKSGKSFFILDCGFRALRGGYKVVLFEVGDMSKHQVMCRMASRFAKRPIGAKSYRVPVGVDEEGEFTWKRKVTTKRMTPGEVFREVKRGCRGRDMFRLSCHGNSTIDVHGIESILRDWGRTGWVPDVVLIDYADILAPPAGIKDQLEQVDVTWKSLRRLSQEFHCLVVTATQSNAAAYSNKHTTLRKQHFSGRKTKLAHVTGMVGLNVSDEFRGKGLTGLNWVVRRDDAYSESKMVRVAGCFDIANPAMKSFEKKFQKQ